MAKAPKIANKLGYLAPYPYYLGQIIAVHKKLGAVMVVGANEVLVCDSLLKYSPSSIGAKDLDLDSFWYVVLLYNHTSQYGKNRTDIDWWDISKWFSLNDKSKAKNLVNENNISKEQKTILSHELEYCEDKDLFPPGSFVNLEVFNEINNCKVISSRMCYRIVIERTLFGTEKTHSRVLQNHLLHVLDEHGREFSVEAEDVVEQSKEKKGRYEVH